MQRKIIENRQIRIFISSTFRDMEAERNYLMKHIFPQLRAKAALRDVSLVELDLRWGITEEEAKTGKVIEICLNEIENSHPFFIGLLGDRYGWQPDVKEIEKNLNLKERYPWIIEDLKSGLSVTEMEMQYGVLRSQADLDASFYIKNSSKPTAIDEDEDAQQKLEHLKKTVMENKRYPYYHYSTPEDIGEQITKDFEALLDKYFPEKNMSSLERERNAQRSVCSNLCASYIAVEENFKALDDFLCSEESYYCVVAESGLGKSALMANWVKRLEGKCDIIYHFVGNSDSGNNYETILKRFVDEICERFAIELSEEEKQKESKDLITSVLYRVPADRKVVLVLDAVNQIKEEDYAKQLAWLPALPENVKLVMTTLPEDDTFTAINRRGISTFTLKPLERADRIKMVTEYLRRYGKALTQSQVARIVDDAQNENTLALKTLLNQLIVFGKHEELDNRINYYLEAETVADFFQKVLLRAEEDYGAALVCHALSLIALSRNGMAESELTDIMGCKPLYWSQMYCAFIMHFNVKNGLINFAHSYIREAVIERYLNDESQVKTLRSEIVSYFKDVEIPRAYDEIPYQYFLMDDCVMLHEFMLNLNHFSYLYNKDKLELCKYWQKLSADEQNEYSPKEYTELIEQLDSLDLKAMFYNYLGYFSNSYFVDLELSLECYSKALDIQIQLFGELHPDTATSYNNLGGTYYSMGQNDKALEYYQKALDIEIQLFGEMHSATATSYNNIGGTYDSMGQNDKALEYYQKALDIEIQLLGEMHPATATSYNNIGGTYDSMGQNDKALEYIQKALDIRIQLFGEMHPATAASYNNIGYIYGSMGQNDKALEYKKKALDIQIQLFGELHPATAISYNNIGGTYDSMGQNDKALEYYQKALDIRIRLFGEMHPDTATSYNNIGGTYSSMGQNDKALEYKKKALDIRIQLFGELHPATATSYNNIGGTYSSMGQNDKALEYFQKALDIQIQLFGELHPATAKSYNNIGGAYSSMGQNDKALEYHQKALYIQIQLFGEIHPATATSYNNIGYTYDSMGQNEKSLEYYQKALDIEIQLFGELHPATATSYNNIGGTYSSMGQNDKALEYHQKALDIRIQLFGELHPATATSYNNIGYTYDSMGQNEKSLEYYQKALDIEIQLFGEIHPATAACYNNIGGIYESMGENDKALENYQKALDIRIQLFGEIHPATAKSYNNIGGIYDSMGQNEKSLEYYQKALDIEIQLFGEIHPATAKSYNNLGHTYDSMGQNEKSLEYYQKALDIEIQLFGEMHPYTAISYDCIGGIYYSMGQNDKALGYLQKALDIRIQLFGEMHPYTAISYGNIGGIYQSMGENEKALEYYQKVLDIQNQLLGEKHPDTIATRNNIES